ncbi:MAG: glutamine--fructose-6-phosphate transaminase (isomerizing) [Chloroflexi bacterium]|nr:glutamine--fructose-6-phosphate transaminase (isomerizing) [Chloroflexota bacterium]
MCGIIGYTGKRPAGPILMEGLSRLEYRGYDSAGIAILTPEGTLEIRKAPGKLARLASVLENGYPMGFSGIGHTRWATHGAPTESNAHPHTDCSGRVTIVHNGIIENFMELKTRLLEAGHIFRSQTDTEVVAHLLEEDLSRGNSLVEALCHTARLIEGANAVVAMNAGEPGTIAGVRLGNAGGLVAAYGREEALLASDLLAVVGHSRRITYLAHGEVTVLTPEEVSFLDLSGKPLHKEAHTVQLDPVSVAKGPFKHFMLKEIWEQPEAVTNTLRGRVNFETSEVYLEDFPLTDTELQAIDQVLFIGMGTSYHAAQVARLMMEKLAQVPAYAENSSEFRYRDPILNERTLVVSIGQSGETADTLSAMEEARKKGARLLTICNVEGSQATRLAEGVVFMRAGPEVCVCATKTFTCSLAASYVLAIYMAARRGVLPPTRSANIVRELASLPQLLGRLLADYRSVETVAARLFKYSNFLYLARGIHYPLALEGALKLKEISYIHAEGCPAGEMKHGPIALIDENMPVVTIAPRDGLRDKMLNNISEIKARGGLILALGTEGDTELASKADSTLYMPAASELVTPMLAAIPLQLLAYYIALRRGCDIDQPRNLAKSVTVE